jgi:uncharacterized protein
VNPPADVGNGIVVASFGAESSWLSIGTTDEQLGFVELNGLPRFDESNRSRVAAVRRYRQQMQDSHLAVLGVSGAVAVDRAAPPGGRTVNQRYVAAAGHVVIRFTGRLDRPAYAEVTDINPLVPLDLVPSIDARGPQLVVGSGRSAVTATIEVRLPPGIDASWAATSATTAALQFDAGDRVEFVVACTLGTARDARPRPTGPTSIEPSPPRWLVIPPETRADVARVAAGAVRYTLDCTTLDGGAGTAVILTDHRILPLSWTRDAYYQALAVLRSAPDTIAAHLRWLWQRCDRPGGLWQRSYQANGVVKDWALQADQQLYPVLELLDYRDAAGSWPPGDPTTAWGGQVRRVWEALPRDSHSGLLVSDENPADDPTGLPLLLSTQILYWHAARRLATHAAELGLGDIDLAAEATTVRAAVLDRFAVDGPLGEQWAYAVDARGSHRLYHDANELSVAFAPCFGFVAPDEPVWQATMRFAFSTANPAYVGGPFGGLGSAHTPGVWPLGDVQEWVWASLSGDVPRAASCVAKLLTIADADGLLPETYDPVEKTWLSRRWFAWPGSAVAALAGGSLG